MRIVYVLSVSWGGIPHYAAELANAISRYADVVVLKPEDSNDLFSENVRVINAFKSMFFPRGRDVIRAFSRNNVISFFSYKNIKLIDELKPDVIHFPELYPQTSIFTFLYKFHKRYPIVSTLHATFESPLHIFLTVQGNFVYKILSFITEITKHLVKSDMIIVHTQEDKNKLIKKGINPDKIVVIPHGAYTLFKKYGETKEKEKGNRVLFFGYIVEGKGLEYLLKAVPEIAREVPDVKVVIAGEGDITKYFHYITNISRFLEIHNYFIPNEMVPIFFSRSKVVVLPYISHGGHSGVLATAFGFGKPVVVTNVGSLPELVEDGKEGFVVPPRDPEALARAVIRILKDEKLREEMKKNTLRKAEQLSWDNIARMHLKVYEEAIERRCRCIGK